MKKELLPSRPLYEDVAEILREKIFSHELEPGSWIDESSLTEQLGISRTPLREAIKVLSAEGLITMKLRRGAYVTEVTSQDLHHIFQVLALLESQAAKDVALKANDHQLEILDAIHTKLEKSAADRDMERFFDINQEFHDKLIEISGNEWMRRVIQDLRKVLKLKRKTSLSKQGRLEQSLLEHRQILTALITRNPNQAETLMKNHLKQGEEAAI